MNSKFSIQFLILIFNLLALTYAATTARILKEYCTYQSDSTTQFYDLRPLSLKDNYLTIQNGSDKYLINICSSENYFKPDYDLCSSASICLVNKEHSHGLTIARLTKDNFDLNQNGNLIMKFNENSNQALPGCEQIESSITFICKKTRPHENPPKLKGKSKCNFDFEWHTSEVCADPHATIKPLSEKEPLIFLVGDEKFDLNSIIKPQLIKTDSENKEPYDFLIKMKEFLQIDNNKAKYNLNLTKCEDSFVCQLNSNKKFVRPIGKLINSELKYENHIFHHTISSDSKCGRSDNGNTSVIFNLHCGDEEKATFKAENNACHYIFDVVHPKICNLKMPSNTLTTEKSTELKTQKPSTIPPPKTTTKSQQNIIPKLQNPTSPKTSENSQTKTKVPNTSITLESLKSQSVSVKQASVTTENNQKDSNTTLFGFIILVIVSIVGIVLALFSLINDDRRSWLQNRVRRVIKPQASTSFAYSQVHNDSSRLVPLDSVTDE